MRIYGTSPLYNYVELVFRCKRMFVVSILLGTVITSLIVWSRSTMYEAGMLVALSGDPDIAQQNISLNTNMRQSPEESSAKRKANRLAIWLQRTPQFLEEVVQDAKLTSKYPGKTTAMLARDVRKKLTEPTLLNDMFMEVKIIWPKPDEAESILNRIFSRFHEQTVAMETLSQTKRKEILEQQLVDTSRDADRKAKLRAEWMSKGGYFSRPDMMAQNFTQREILSHELASAQIDLEESKTRLVEVSNSLADTPREINQGVEEVFVDVNPALGAKEELDRLMKELQQVLAVYSAEHPKAKELLNKVNLQKLVVSDLEKQKPRPKETNRTRRTALNPQWQQLDTRKSELRERVRGYERRVAQLSQELGTVDQRIRSAPQGEIAYATVERGWKQAETVRQYTENQLAAARLDEQRDKMTQSRSVKLEVQPKAEKIDSGAKVLFLYALGPILGIVIAFCFSLVAESLDHTLRTPVEVERYLGKPVLAVIPKLRALRNRKGLAGGAHASIGS